ncbi:MAG: hypothetical protein QXK96_01680 [Candidatus Bathyarchaeia archaeon]
MPLQSDSKGPKQNEEATKAILSGLVLLSVFGLATYYAIVTSTPSIQATKLKILAPSEYAIGTVVELTVQAVNDEGEVDISRRDLIRISVDPESHARLGVSTTSGTAWSSSLTLNLGAGSCTVKFSDSEAEKVVVSVEWLEGETPLISDSIQLSCGWPGF